MTDNTGDTIGRDKIVHGDVVGQDKVAGDKIVSEQNIYGDLHIHHAPVEPAAPPVDFAAIEQRYREQVVKHYNKLALTGLPERERNLNEIMLENIFIKLNIALPQAEGRNIVLLEERLRLEEDLFTLGKFGDFERRKELEQMQRKSLESTTLSVAEALHYRHLMVIGGPGSGKTMLTRWLAVIFARHEQAKPENLGAKLAEERIPIILELRRFTDYFVSLSQRPAVPNLATEIASFISQHSYYPETPAAFIQQALADGRCLLLLDGFDEIADLKARQLLSDAVQAFLQHTNQGYRQNLLLVTSRPHGYQNISLSAFQECEVKPFTKEDVASFIRHWYDTAYKDQEQSKANDLIIAIQANDRIGELATTPLLSTLIIILYHKNGALPSRRTDLYLQCCKLLLFTWERNKSAHTSAMVGHEEKWESVLKLLEPLAFWLHSDKKQLSATEDEFVEQLTPIFQKKRFLDSITASQEARRFIIDIRDRSGILQRRGDNTLEFIHLTFQEYLAARHIAAQSYPHYIDCVMAHLHEAWWLEVNLLVIGQLGSSDNTPNAFKVSSLLNALLTLYPRPFFWLRTEFRLFPFIGYLLPYWQWQLRLAWAISRELELAIQGALDCSQFSVPQPTISLLQRLAVEWLLRLIHNPAHTRRYFLDFSDILRNAVTLIGSLGQRWGDELVIQSIQTKLSDSKQHVRDAAAATLGQLGRIDPNISTGLLKTLKHANSNVREATVTALGQIGNLKPNVVNAMIIMLNDSSGNVRAATAIALGQLRQNDVDIVIPLTAAINDPVGSVRRAVVSSLGQIAKNNLSIVDILIATLNDPVGYVRQIAANALGQLGRNEPSVVTGLLTALEDQEWYVRAAASQALGLLGHSSSIIIAPLLTGLGDPDENVRQYAAHALDQLGHQNNQDVLESLMTALNDIKDDNRAGAAAALGRLGQSNPTIIDALLASLNDSERTVRLTAANALGQLGQGSPAIIDALLASLNDSERIVRLTAANALGQLGNSSPAIIDALLASLNDSERTVRLTAANALGQLGQSNPAIIDALLVALNDSERTVRLIATTTLGNLTIKDEAILQTVLIALNQRLHDSRNGVRQAALKAIMQLLAGRSLPGYRWVPIRLRSERQRKFKQFSWWSGAGCMLILIVLFIVDLWARLDANDLLMRFGTAVVLITGLAAGVAQVLGWTLRSPYEKHEP